MSREVTCGATPDAIRQFRVANASNTVADLKGGPTLHVVGHRLVLEAAVSPLVGIVRFSTSAGPLSPPDHLVSVDVVVDSQQMAEAAITVPGRPDRVVADAFLREDLFQACGLLDPALLGESLLRIWIEP